MGYRRPILGTNVIIAANIWLSQYWLQLSFYGTSHVKASETSFVYISFTVIKKYWRTSQSESNLLEIPYQLLTL